MDQLTGKPWGSERLLEHTDKYALKQIFIRKGYRTSLQKHVQKCETNYIKSGYIRLELDNSFELLEPGKHFTVHPGQVHRITALDDTIIIECSTPELDDVIRLEDDYGRQESTEV